MLARIRRDIAAKLQLSVSSETWKSDFDEVESPKFQNRPDLAPEATHFATDILTVKDAIFDLTEKGYSRRNDISAFAEEMRIETEWMPNQVRNVVTKTSLKNHIHRNQAEHIKTRFRLYKYIRDQNIHPKVIAIARDPELTAKEQRKKIKNALSKVKLPACSPDKKAVANDINELVGVVVKLSIKKHSQRPLEWGVPSPHRLKFAR